MANTYVDFLVTGDPATARATVEQALGSRNFQLTWQDEWTATAERGNRVANVIAGALAHYVRVKLKLLTAQPEQTVVRVEKASSGAAGGVIGMMRTKRNFESLASVLRATFSAAGVLLN